MRRVGPLEEMGWAQGSGLAACAVVRGGEGLFAPRGGVREVEQACENDALNWPHCDVLNWPHLSVRS